MNPVVLHYKYTPPPCERRTLPVVKSLLHKHSGSLSMADENSVDGAMEKKNFEMSGKNIPLSMKQEHNIQTISKSERLVRRMRWEATFFLNPLEAGRRKETFGESH